MQPYLSLLYGQMQVKWAVAGAYGAQESAVHCRQTALL